MNIKRFHAPTAREALAQARMAFGEGTLILSNRTVGNGVEVVATGEDTLALLDETMGSDQGASTGPAKTDKPAPANKSALSRSPSRSSAAPRAQAAALDSVTEDTEQMAMSTLSFQDYVRERMLRRRAEALQGNTTGTASKANTATPTLSQLSRDRANELERERLRERPALMPQAKVPSPVRHALGIELPSAPLARKALEPSLPAQLHGGTTESLLGELQSVKDLIEERFNTLTWLNQARQSPVGSNLMIKLLRAGYSPALARAILERMPEDLSATNAVRWLMEVLERNLKTDAPRPALYEEGGVFALVGSTGVGKTTTTAKLAALCARMYGPSSVGLITLDTYRVGAHEQLGSYGRMMGIVAHLAHDRSALEDLLGLLSGKKMVLIDTTGVAPRDPRKRDMLDVLDIPGVQRLLVLNAGYHGDTLDDVLTSFRTTGSQQAILSKVDEAVKLGPAIDALVRHQMVLRGITNGQRVPEDWAAADAHQLVSMSLQTPAKSAFDPKVSDLNFFFSSVPESLYA